MYLRITSLDSVVFEWEVKKIIVPSEEWELAILPNHIPLTCTTKAGIIQLVPKNHEESFIKSWDFLFDDDKISISVSKWIFYTDWNINILNTSVASTTPEESKENLEKMKLELQEKLQELQKNWNIEEIEATSQELEKISADIKLTKFKS